jgi:hypothetical protein
MGLKPSFIPMTRPNVQTGSNRPINQPETHSLKQLTPFTAFWALFPFFIFHTPQPYVWTPCRIFIFLAHIFIFSLSTLFFLSHTYFRIRFIILHFVSIFAFTSFIFSAHNLECTYRFDVNNSCIFIFLAYFRMYI